MKAWQVGITVLALAALLASALSPLPLPAVAEAASGAEIAAGATVFVENRGQFPAEVRFQAQFEGGMLWLAADALWLMQVEPGSARAAVVRLTFPEGAALRFTPLQRAPGRLNYYRGDPAIWRADVPLWQAVRIEGVAPGAALELDGRGAGLAWRVTAVETLAVRVEGAEALQADRAGLQIHTALGALQLPLAATAIQGDVAQLDARAPESPASAAALLAGTGLFGTYLGGSGDDEARAVAVGNDGSVYVTGMTRSAAFPRTTGAVTVSGSEDAFVTRLAADGRTLIYSTYLGGSYTSNYDAERGNAIAVDAGGFAYVTGITCSGDFPTTAGAYDRTYNGPTTSRQYGDAFVTRLTPTGALAYSSYLGGSGRYFNGANRFDDEGWGIAVHNGRIYIAGSTSSTDFPTTAGAYDRTYAGSQGSLQDAFLTVLNPAGGGASDLVYSTYFGNSNSVSAYALAVDSVGNAYLTGHIYNSYGDFPITAGAYAATRSDDRSAFVAKINPTGGGASDLRYSTYLDGSNYDVGYRIAVDAAGLIYVTGATRSPNFPTTTGAFDTTCGSDGNCNSARFDAFVIQLHPGGQGNADLRYGTFLGGAMAEGDHYDMTDDFGGIALLPNGDVLVTGATASSDFPKTADAQQGFRNGERDAFLTRLRLQGQGAADLIYSTYLSGHNGRGIAAADAQTACVAGNTIYGDALITAGAYDTTFNGNSDGFVVCAAVPPRPNLEPSTKTVAPERAVVGEVVTFTVRLVNSGVLAASARVTDTLPAALLFHGAPQASAGAAPVVAGQTLTWNGTVAAGAVVTLTYSAALTSTTGAAPVAVNRARIADGLGAVYIRAAYVNGYKVYLPLTLRQQLSP